MDPSADAWADAHITDLPSLLAPGDLLVLNDAATLPASLTGTDESGNAVELRLLDGADLSHGRARVVVFGAGDWHTPTERRASPPLFPSGATLTFGTQLTATILAHDPRFTRLCSVQFNCVGATLIHALYALGRPIQYSYLAADVPLGAVQTAFATRPWAMEMPSAARPLDVALLLALRKRGLRITTLTHAASLSATGDDALDALLPLPERYEIPQQAVDAIRSTKAAGGRVIAAGTTVARALEGASQKAGGLVAGPGETDLVLDAGYVATVINGLLSNMHDVSESHFRVLATLAPERLLIAANQHAAEAGYLAHEFGDSTLVLAGALAGRGGGLSTRQGP